MSSPIRSNVTANGHSPSEDEGVHPAIPVVRQLKPPPEIWELVHPVTTQKSKSGHSFLSRLSSRWTILVLFAFVGGAGAGGAAALWKHPAAKAFLSGLQTKTSITQQKPVTADTSTTTPPQASLPVATSAEAATTAATEAGPANTVPETVAPDQQAQSASNGSVTHAAGRRSAPDRRLKTPDAAIGIRVGSSATPTGQGPDSSRNSGQKPTDSASTKPKSTAGENSQVVAPAKPNVPKAKVIPWP